MVGMSDHVVWLGHDEPIPVLDRIEIRHESSIDESGSSDESICSELPTSQIAPMTPQQPSQEQFFRRNVACSSVASGPVRYSRVAPTFHWPSRHCQPRFSQRAPYVNCPETTQVISKESGLGLLMLATNGPTVNAATVPTRILPPFGGHAHGQHSLHMSQSVRDGCRSECFDVKRVAVLSSPFYMASSVTDVQGLASCAEVPEFMSIEEVPRLGEHPRGPRNLTASHYLPSNLVDDLFEGGLDDEDIPFECEGLESQTKVVHACGPETSALAKKKSKPCKGKRVRFRKMMEQIRERIQQNPDAFDFNSLLLPPHIAKDATLQMRLYRRVRTIIEQFRSQPSASLAESASSVS